MDLDERIRNADPADGLEVEIPDPAFITGRGGGLLSRWRGRRTRPPRGSILARLTLAIPALVVAAVVGVVLWSGGHSQRSRRQGSATTPTGRVKGDTGLAVLRRSQTAKDRTLPRAVMHAVRAAGGPLTGPDAPAEYRHPLGGLISSSARYTQSLPGGQEVFLAEIRAPHTEDGHPRLRLFIVATHGGHPSPIFQTFVLPDGKRALSDAFRPECGSHTEWSLEPNGVAKVRWTFPYRLVNGHTTRRPTTITAPVRGNTAVAAPPADEYFCEKDYTVSLYAGDGHRIATRGPISVPLHPRAGGA